jgi:hypothetical protein
MDAVLQQLEEERVRERFPITYALIMGNQAETAPHWLKWYADWDDVGEDKDWVYAQVGWEPDLGKDLKIGSFNAEHLAENAVNAHNLILENVQRGDFGKAAA